MPARLFIAIVLLAPASLLRAGEPQGFPDARHGNGDLRHIDGVPVMIVRGKPIEMGEQFGKLAIENAPDLNGLHQRFLKDAGQEKRYSLIVSAATALKPNFPPHILTEVEAAARSSKQDLSLLLYANTLADLSSGMGCSTLVIAAERSKTGSPLFGRNFDWLATEGIIEHTLVAVYKGESKHAFATATVSPICGVISGMNDAGLSITINEIRIKKSKDESTFNWKGTPLLLAFRRVLEECTSVSEAEKLLREMPRTTTCCLTLCDKTGGAVFEITPNNLVVRAPENGVTCCTNHFRSDKLCVEDKCWRYEKLATLLQKNAGKLDVSDVFAKLDEVNQGRSTIQSMVFEPAQRVLNLSYGYGPSSKLRPHRLDLGKLFEEK